MCEYCTPKETNKKFNKCKNNNGIYIEIYYKDGSGDLNYECDCGCGFGGYVDADYCYKCGRKLEV